MAVTETFPTPAAPPVAPPQPGVPTTEMVPGAMPAEAATAVLPATPEASPLPTISKEEAANLSITDLVVASENDQTSDKTYFSEIKHRAHKIGDRAGELGERRMQLHKEMGINEAQTDDAQKAAYEAARIEAVAIDDMTSFMRPRQRKAFTAVTGEEYLGPKPSRTRRALKAVANVPTRANEAVVGVQNELAGRSRTSKFAGVVAVGAAVGIFAATKNMHAASHGHELLVQGTAHTIHAQEAAYTTPANVDHAKAVLDVDAEVVKSGHKAIADAVEQTVQAHGNPSGVEVHNYPGDPHVYNHSTVYKDAMDVVAVAVPVAVLGAGPVLLGFQLNGRRLIRKEHHEAAHHMRHKQHTLGEARKVITNHAPEGDAYLRLAKGRAGPQGLVSDYMDVMAHRLHIDDTRHMAEHLRSLDIPVHKSEIIRTPAGQFLYFAQGRDGLDQNTMRSYMEDPAVRSRYTTPDAMYQHLHGELGLNVKRSQISLNGRAGAGFHYARVDGSGSRIKDSATNTHAFDLDVKPERSGVNAGARAAKAANFLRGKTESTPLYGDFLGSPPVALAMQELRHQVVGSPHGVTNGLLDERARLVARRDRATDRTIYNTLTTDLADLDREIHDRVTTILHPIAGNVGAAQALGIFSLRAQRGNTDGFAFSDDRTPRIGQGEANLAAYLRSLDER